MRGQSVVEFALVLPVLMLIALLMVDMGRIFLGWITVNNAARVAANYAAMNAPAWGATPNATIQANYAALVKGDTGGLNCTPTDNPQPTFPTGTNAGDPVVVNIDCTFQFLTPFIGNLFTDQAVTMHAQAVFPVREAIVAGGGPAGPPVINSVTYTPHSGTLPLNVVFTADTTNVVVWVWDFGDGTGPGPGDASTNHTYASAGVYHVTLVGISVDGKTTATYPVGDVTVTSAASDTAKFSVSPTPPTGTAPFTVTFTDLSTPTPKSWTWTFGDGTTSPLENPSHQYMNSGTYVATLQATFPDNTTATYSATITVNPSTGTQCTVPNLTKDQSDKADADWKAAGFKQNVQFQPLPLDKYNIQSQLDGSASSPYPVLTPGIRRSCDSQIVVVTGTNKP